MSTGRGRARDARPREIHPTRTRKRPELVLRAWTSSLKTVYGSASPACVRLAHATPAKSRPRSTPCTTVSCAPCASGAPCATRRGGRLDLPHRDQRGRAGTGPGPSRSPASGDVASEHPDVEAVREALAALPERQRLALFLRYDADLDSTRDRRGARHPRGRRPPPCTPPTRPADAGSREVCIRWTRSARARVPPTGHGDWAASCATRASPAGAVGLRGALVLIRRRGAGGGLRRARPP